MCALTASCGRAVRSVDVSTAQAQAAQLLSDPPDIVVGTPSRVLACIKAGSLDLRYALFYLHLLDIVSISLQEKNLKMPFLITK